MVFAAFVDVLTMIDERITDRLLGISGPRTKLRQAINHILHQVETVHLVEHDHIERRGGRAFFFVAADVEILVVRAAVCKAMDKG